MLRLPKAPRDEAFATSVAIANARTAVAESIRTRTKPSFASLWGDYKAALSAAQHGRCGFCEQKVIGGQFGDVEHFRPKGEIWKLKDDPATWGVERPHLSTLEGRKHDTVRTTGYWWLAYEWSNYLLCCSTCNSVYKASFFPVVDDEYADGPQSNRRERPLLLNPFSGPRPETHLDYDEIGTVVARNDSRIGRTTIVYLGLNRAALREERMQIAMRVMRAIRDLLAGSEELRRRAVEDIHEMGRTGNMFAGMVRIMFRNNTGTTWRELERLVGTEDRDG